MAKQGQIEQLNTYVRHIFFQINSVPVTGTFCTAFLLHIRKIFKEFQDQQVNNMQM